MNVKRNIDLGINPCPICGGNDYMGIVEEPPGLVHDVENDEWYVSGKARMRCMNLKCGFEIQTKTIEDAIKAWNRKEAGL